MIKHRLLTLLTLVCMMTCAANLFAQVTVSIVPRQNPLPAQGTLYMTDPGRFFNVSLTNSSANEIIPVRLEARIEGPIEGGFDYLPDNGSFLATYAQRTMPIYIPLQPGQTRVLTQTDLYNMFRQYDAGTEMAGGGQLYDAFQSGSNNGAFGLLPEGHYGLTLTAKTNYTDRNDPGDVIGEGTCFFDICYNASPPRFNNITYIDGESGFVGVNGYNTAYFPTNNPRFSWDEPVFNSVKVSVKRQFLYDFRIYQITLNQDPSEAVLYNGNLTFEQLGLMTPYCVVPYNVVARMKRFQNVKYVAQVTARPLVTDASNPNYTIIGNEGKSDMIVLMMEDVVAGSSDNDIIVDNATREYPITVSIMPKYTELPSAMYGYFETPGELFDITLENTSNEDIPVCMLLQYFKANWGVTAAPMRQHTDKYYTVPAGKTVALTEEEINDLAGGYDFDADVIAFKAKTGFIIGKPTYEHFLEKEDTAFLRVCRYTGGKPVLRETIIGKGRAPFTVNANLLSGEMFDIRLEPKMVSLPLDGEEYFTTPSRLFTLKMKSLAPRQIRVYPALSYFVNYNYEDERAAFAYNGEYLKGPRLVENYITFAPNEEKTFTDEEIDRYFGGFTQVKERVIGDDVNLIDDLSTIKFDTEDAHAFNLSLFDYDKLSQLDFENGANPQDALLYEYRQDYTTSEYSRLGDVDILIEPVDGFPVQSDVYVEDPGRLFKVTLNNLTDKEQKLIPGITYERRVIDGEEYSYTPSVWYTKPEFVLQPHEKKVLDSNFMYEYCGDETVARITLSDGTIIEDYENIDEIIDPEGVNHFQFILVNADSARAIPAGTEGREERIIVATQSYDFYPDPDYVLYDLDIDVRLKMDPMPYNARAYFTKPEQMFEVWIGNSTSKDIEIKPMVWYEFNNNTKEAYISGSYDDPDVETIIIEPGDKKLMKDDYAHNFITNSLFYKMIAQDGGGFERLPYDIYNADKDITLDPEMFTTLHFAALDPAWVEAKGSDAPIEDFFLGKGKISFQVSSTTRLDDVSVTVKPRMDPLPADGKLYFNSPGTLFDIELKNNTLNEYNVIPNMMYLFDEYGTYFGSVYDDDHLENFVTLAPGEIKLITASDLNTMCGTPDTIKAFEKHKDGFIEKPIPDIDAVLNLEAFSQVEVIAYCVDSLKSLPKEMTDRKQRAMLGGGKSDFNIRNIKFEEVVVNIAPKPEADFRPEIDKYFEKPGDLFDVTLLNVTNEEQKVHLRLTYNNRYFIDKPDSIITLKPEEKLKLSADRLNKICGYDIYSYGAPLFECDPAGKVLNDKPSATDIEMKKGDNTVTALAWKKLIEDESKPTVYKVDSVSVCDTIFQPALLDLWIGEYRLTLTDFEKITGKDPKMKEEGNDCFKGKGYVHTTIMGVPVRVAVEYDSIYIDNDLQRVVKNSVRSITEESAHVPLDLFKEELVTELQKSDKEGAEAKVDQLLKESNVGAFYTYVLGNAMQTIGKVDSSAVVKLPLGLTVPLDKELECPATIQLAKMEFNPTDANMDLIGEFVLPESPDPENLAYSDILIFAARKLSTSPEEFLPKNGSLGLVKDFSLQDPSSEFIFTFKAPTNQDYSKATDGCFIAWENNSFKEMCASISINVPSSMIVKDNGVDPIDPSVHPEVTLTAFIADAEDWFATVKMDPFQIASAPGYTFNAVGDSVGIVFDYSKRRTPAGIKFPKGYDYDKDGLGLSADPSTSAEAYNEWQGFYFEELSCKLPHFVELDDKGDSRAKIAVKNIIYDESGFSMAVEVDSLLNRGTPEVGGWRITLDNIYLNVKQNEFGSSGFNGRVEVPLLYKKGTQEKAQLGYKAEINSIAHGKENGLEVNFKMQQLEDSISLDFMLAEVNFNKDSTYFNIVYCDTLPKEKQTLVELCLDGDITIRSSEKIDFELPKVKFENMRIANFEEKGNNNKGSGDDKKSTAGKSLNDPNGDTDFSTGKWALSGDPGEEEGSFWGGMPIVLNSISMKVGDGAKHLGLYIEGGINIMGNKKFGIATSVGLTIWSEVNWDDMALKYDSLEFSKLKVQGDFAGMISVEGDLAVSDAEDKSGFDGELGLKVKGLFEIDVAGGYYKMLKTEEDLKLDDAEEKKDKYYHAGYFLAKAKMKQPIYIGPVGLNGISGGLFINYGVDISDVQGSDDFIGSLKENLEPRYKSYGGMFGVGLVVGEETLIKGDATMLLMIDIQKDGVRVPGVLLEGNISALCAPDSDSGLINAKVTMLYEDTTTPDLTDEEKKTMTSEQITANAKSKKDEYRKFRLSITADADIAAAYKKFTGEEYQVENPMVGLEEFDQKNADSENQGEQKNTASSASAAESKGYIKAKAGATIALEFEVRDYPSSGKTFWHLYVGEPDEDKRCRVTFIDFEFGRDKPVGLWAKLYANMYLCIGNELPGNGQLPPLPKKVEEALGMEGADGKVDTSLKSKLEAARKQVMLGGPAGDINGGIMMGAAIGAEIGCNAIFCYANVEGMLGFDLILKQYKEGIRCTDGSRAGGKNGFYATGQFYAMLKGELGLMINLWIFEGKVPLVDMTLGALLQGGFPNPTWVYGRLRAKGSVLGGLIKFNSTIEMKAGKVCVPEMGNPLDDIKVFGGINPGDEDLEIGWDEKNLVSCYGESTFTTNMKIGKTLTLVDEGETMNRAGMDGEPVDVLRKYVFYLDNQFELKEYDESDATNDNRTAKSYYVTHTNPTYDKENYKIQMGSLKARRLYRLKLRGTCKEIVNGDPVDPLYKDTITGKMKSRPFADERYIYFRTDKLSDNINDEVAGFIPNLSYFTQSLEEVTQPSFMEKNARSDYWLNPDHEFAASIKVYDSGTGQYVFPDARQGLRKGQVTKFDNLEVVEIRETGVDEGGNALEFATVTIKKPVPGEYFKASDKIRFEIRRINRTQLDAYIDMIEENYKSIVALSKEEQANYEAQLNAMDAAIAEGDKKAGDKNTNQAIRDLYNYYKEMSELYGENEAEQRIREYKEELKANSSAFAEVVYTQDYTYNGYKSFHDYISSSDYWEYTGSGITDINTSPLYCKIDDILTTEELNVNVGSGVNDPNAVYSYNPRKYETRSNNPYFALNYWFSKATAWKAPVYDFCDRQFDECKYIGNPNLHFRSLSFPYMRNGTPSHKMDDAAFEKYLNPKFAVNWFAFDDIDTNNGTRGKIRLFKAITYAIAVDAGLAQSLEDQLKKCYKDYFKGYIDSKNWKALKSTNSYNAQYGHTLAAPYTITSSGNKVAYNYAYMPLWQIPLMYAADMGKYGINTGNCREKTSAYKYFTGAFSTFKASNYISRVKKIKVRVRFADGYNIAMASRVQNRGTKVARTDYGVRPSTSARRTALLTCDVNGNGMNGVSSGNMSVEREEFVTISDPVLFKYLLQEFDDNEDGRLHVNELSSVTSLSINFNNYYILPERPGGQTSYIMSLDGLKHLPNLQYLYLYNNMSGDMSRNTHAPANFRSVNSTLRFEGNPKLKKLVLDRWYVDSLDLRYNSELEEVNIDMRSSKGTINSSTMKGKEGVRYLDVSKCTSLTKLKVIDCRLVRIDLSGISTLTEIDLRLNLLGSVDISESYKLTQDKVALGYQVTSTGQIAYNRTRQLNATTYNVSPTDVNSSTSKNYKVKFTLAAKKTGQENKLDKNLEDYIKEQAAKAGKDPFVWASTQTTLNVSGKKIKSLKNLDHWMPKLAHLYVNENELTELDLTGFSEMLRVFANDNKLTAVKVRDENKIYWMELNDNSLRSLPYDLLTKLKHLKCRNNNIEYIYFNNNSILEYLDCSSNYITELALGKQTKLTYLNCSYNNFENGKLELPKANFATFEAKKCLNGITTIDLSSSTGIKYINVSDNQSLKTLKLASSTSNIVELIASNCALTSLTSGSDMFPLFNYNNQMQPVRALTSLETVDVSNNPGLSLSVVYKKEVYPKLKAIEITGCNVGSVYLRGTSIGKLTKLCAGVPQRASGRKVAVVVFDKVWYGKWDEWKDYPENKFTTYMKLYNDNMKELESYDNSSTTLETITDNDKKLREAMGETFYSIMKEKYAPNKRALHTADVSGITELQCANMKINDLDFMLKYMPKAKVVNAAGNEMKTVILNNLSGVDKLDLSNNPSLDSLSFNNQSGKLDEINLSYTYFNEYGLINAMKVAHKKKVLANGDVGPKNLRVALNKYYSYPIELSLVSKEREFTIYNLQTDKLTIGGKSVKFYVGYVGSIKCAPKIDRLYLAESTEPIELIFNSADMALLWLNKWIDDNPNRKFTMKVESGDASVDAKMNTLLGLINSQTKNGIGRLPENTRKTANSYVLKYVWDGSIAKGDQFNALMDKYNLHEKRTNEDVAMEKAMGSTLYNKLRKQYAPEREYLLVSDVKSLTTLDCSDCAISNLNAILKYMPAVKVIKAGKNSLKSVTLGEKSALTSVDLSKGKTRLDTLNFKNTVGTLDLSGTTMYKASFETAVKNTTTKLTINGGLNLAPVINDKSKCVKELVTDVKTLQLSSCNFTTLTFNGVNLSYNGSYDYVKVSTLNLEATTLYNISFTTADNALRFLIYNASSKNQNAKFTISVGTYAVVNNMLKDYNSLAKVGKGCTKDARKKAISAIIKAVQFGYLSRGNASAYETALNAANSLGIADVQTSKDLELKNALGTTMYNHYKEKYAKSKSYLHISDLSNVTVLDAERTDLVNLTKVLEFMTKVHTVYAGYNDLESVDVSKHNTTIKLLDLSYTPTLRTLKTKTNGIVNIDLSYTYLSNDIVKNALHGASGTVMISGNYGAQLLSLSGVTKGKLRMLNTNRILQLNDCILDSLTFAGERLILKKELQQCNVKNLVLQRTATPVMTVEFHSADVALAFIEAWYRKKPGATLQIELKSTNSSYNATIKSLMTSINTSLKNNGGTVTSSIKTQFYNVVKTAVKSYSMSKGSSYGNYVK